MTIEFNRRQFRVSQSTVSGRVVLLKRTNKGWKPVMYSVCSTTLTNGQLFRRGREMARQYERLYERKSE